MLKQLILQKRMAGLKNQLEALREKDKDFTIRADTLKTREAELEAAVNELTDTSTEEEKTTVDEAVAAFEAEQNTLKSDQETNDDTKKKLEEEIQTLQKELDELDQRANTPPISNHQEPEKRKDDQHMTNRANFFKGMTPEQRSSLVAREDVKSFITRVREFGAQTRAVTGADLLIPEVLVDILRDNITEYSKLITKVNYKPVKGKARQNVTGTIPEAVWTEMEGALNELAIAFNQVEVDGYKVGGFVVIPNSTLQDSDQNLASEVMIQLAKAIGMALDKAILYGLGTKQPLGIVTRLAQTSKPSDYSTNAPAWEDLHTTNVTKVSTTGAALIGSIVTAFAACKNNFSDGRKFFAMNSITHSYLVSTLLNFNAAGALATGMNGQMPIIGGDIVVLDFMSNYDIVGGYGDLYLLAEREGTSLASSEHVKFIEDMTVFKGLARYDGMPVIAEGFFVININNASAATTKTFETDYANTELGALGVTSVAGTLSGDTLITVTGAEVSGTTLGYKVAGKAAAVSCGDSNTGYTAFTTPADITAATGKIITMAEFDAAGRAIKVGSAQVVAKA
ncbi:MAG TPA: phage major capsid protein [Peptococcaceae bacterium]|nr:phage major capsid protein [Peptococcaceae bacterium]